MATPYGKEQIYRDLVAQLPAKAKAKRPERQYQIIEPSAVRAMGLGATGIAPLPREKVAKPLPPSPEQLTQRRADAAFRGAELFNKAGHVALRDIILNLPSDDPYEMDDAFEVAKENTRQAGIAQGFMPGDIEPALVEIERIRTIMQAASFKKRQQVEKAELAMAQAQVGRPGAIGAVERIPQKLAGGTLQTLVRPLADYFSRARGSYYGTIAGAAGAPIGAAPPMGVDPGIAFPTKGIADWADKVLEKNPHWTPKQFEQGVGVLEDPLALLDNIVGSIPLMATAVVTTAVGHPEAAMMLIYAVENQSAYEEAYAYALQQGKTPQEAETEAVRIGQIVGTVNAIIEYAQIRGIMRISGIAKGGLHKVVMELAQKSNAVNVGAHLVTVAREVLFEMAREYGEEGAQEVVSTLVPAVLQDKPFDVYEMLERAHKAGVTAAGAVAVFGAPRVGGAAARAVAPKPAVKPPAPTEKPAEPAQKPPAKPAAVVAPVAPAAPKPREAAPRRAEAKPPAVTKPVTPKPKVTVPPAKPAPIKEKVPKAPTAKVPVGIAEVPLTELRVDPKRFQFKAGLGKAGVGALLKGVKKFYKERAGVVAVWRDPADGLTYIVNGHHRYELARRTGQKTLNVIYIEAETAAIARAKGALINIAEGRGAPIDAAKLFRDLGMTEAELEAEGISLREKLVKRGVALSALSENLFLRVTQGKLSEEMGAIIGTGIKEHAAQEALAKLIEERTRRGRRLSTEHVSELIRFVKSAGVRVAQVKTLFGTEYLKTSNAIEKAQLSTWIKTELAKDKRLFGYVSKAARAERLTEAGNIIDIARSKGISQQAAVVGFYFDKLSTQKGPVADALNKGAKQLAEGGKQDVIRKRTLKAVKAAISEIDTRTTLFPAKVAEEAPGERVAEPEKPTEAEPGKPKPDVTTAEDYATKYQTPSGGLPFDSDATARREHADYLLVFANDPNRDLFHRRAYARAAAMILDPTKIVGDVRKFTKEDWLDIKGIGEAIATKLSQPFAKRSAEVMDFAIAQKQVAAKVPEPPVPPAEAAERVILGVPAITEVPPLAPTPRLTDDIGGLEVGDVYRKADEVVAEAVRDVESQAERVIEPLATEIPGREVRPKRFEAARRFKGIEQNRPETVALELGPKEGSVVHDVLSLKIIEGMSRKQAIMQEAMDALRAVSEKTGIWDNPKALGKWSYDIGGRKVNWLTVTLPAGSAMQKGKQVTKLKLAPSDVMHLALSMRDSDTRGLVEKGVAFVFDRGKFNTAPLALKPAGIEAIIKSLDKDMLAMVDVVLKWMNGPGFKHVNTGWIIEFGQNLLDRPQPDHVPRERAGEYIQTGRVAPIAGGMPMATEGLMYQAPADYVHNVVLSDMRIFQPRTGGTMPIQGRDFFSMFLHHVNSVSQYVGLSAPIQNARWLLGNPEMKQALKKADMQDSATYLRKYFDDVEGMRAETMAPHLKMMRWLRRQTYRVYLSLNVFTRLKMASSYWQAANEMDMKHVLAGTLPGDVSIAQAHKVLIEHSPMLRARFEQTGSHMVGPTANRRVLQQFYTGRTGDWDARLMKGLRKGDMWAIDRLYRAAVSEAKAEGLTGGQIQEQAVKRTEFLTRRTQPVWGAVFDSALARRAHTDWFALIATMFSSQTNQNLNMVRRAAWRLRNSPKTMKDRATKIKVYANVIIVNAILMVGINELRRWVFRGCRLRDDEDEWDLLDYAMDAVGQMTRMYYGGKAVSDFVRAVATGMRKRWPSDPTEGLMDDAVRATADVAQATDEFFSKAEYQIGRRKGERKWKTPALRALKRSRRLGFLIFGIPEFPYQIVKAFVPPGKEESIKRLRKAYRYLITRPKGTPKAELQKISKTIETERERLGLTTGRWGQWTVMKKSVRASVKAKKRKARKK